MERAIDAEGEGEEAEERRCRCCDALVGRHTHTAGAELATEYRWQGARELYAHMLLRTFNIKMSHVKSEHHSRYICDACVSRLRDASSFKKQVLSTEQRFLERLRGHTKEELEDEDDLPIIQIKQESKSPVTTEPEPCDAYDGDINNDDEVTDEDVKRELKYKPPSKKMKLCKDTTRLESNVKKALMVESKTRAIYRNNVDKLLEINRRVRKVLEQREASRPGESTPAVKKKLNKEDLKFRGMRVPIGKVFHTKTKQKTPAIDPESTNTVGGGLSAAEKRAVRKIIKRNALSILKHTTACPFIYYHGNFKCFYCRETFFNFSLLKKHTHEIHFDVKQEAKKIYSFRDLVMVDISTLKCRQCNADFHDIKTIKQHLIDAHNVKINMTHNDDIAAFMLNSTQTFKCHLCVEEFHVFRSLSLHLNVHYQNYMCEICGKPFISWERYRNHEATHSVGHFPCSKCDQIFTTLKARASHSMAEHRVTKYGCPLCTERFDKYLERTVHMSVVHDVTHKFKCPQCPKEFFHKPHLRAHISNRHLLRVKKVECLQCGMRFTDNNALSRHMVSHTGEKQFGCKVCGKKYGRKYSLTEHMRVHAKGQVRNRPMHLMSF